MSQTQTLGSWGRGDLLYSIRSPRRENQTPACLYLWGDTLSYLLKVPVPLTAKCGVSLEDFQLQCALLVFTCAGTGVCIAPASFSS